MVKLVETTRDTDHCTIIGRTARLAFPCGSAAAANFLVSADTLGAVDQKFWDRHRLRQGQGRNNAHGEHGDSGEKSLRMHCELSWAWALGLVLGVLMW